jgi:hypothetical protein
MTRRDVTTIGLYVTVFATVVAWASLRPSGDNPGAGHVNRASVGAPLLERAEGPPELRRIIQRMLVR